MNILNVFLDFFMLCIVLFCVFLVINYFRGLIVMSLSSRKLRNLYRIKCTQCGTVFNPYDRIDGCPAGLTLQMRDGSVVHLCFKCICDQNFEGLEGGVERE